MIRDILWDKPDRSRFRSLNALFSSRREDNSACTVLRALASVASARLMAASLSCANSRTGLIKGMNFLRNLFFASKCLGKL